MNQERYEEIAAAIGISVGQVRRVITMASAPTDVQEDAYSAPVLGWCCFHCAAYFPESEEEAAKEHFGDSPMESKAACIIKAEEGGLVQAIRFLEERNRDLYGQIARYSDEDSAADRRMAKLVTEHYTAVQRAEEAGYAKGLKQAQAWRADRIAMWAHDTFGPATPFSTTIRALRELLELAELLAVSDEEALTGCEVMSHLANDLQKYEAAHRASIIIDQSIGAKAMEEVADVRIVLARVHTFFAGVLTDEEAQDAKMEINARRKWKLDGHGHGQHIGEDHDERQGQAET